MWKLVSVIPYEYILWLGWIMDVLALLFLLFLEITGANEEIRQDYFW